MNRPQLVEGRLWGGVVVWALLGIGVGWLATERGRSGAGFCLLSVVLSPLIGLVVVLVLPNLVKREEEQREKQEADRKSKQESERQHERQLEEIRALSSAVAKPTGSPSAPSRSEASHGSLPLTSHPCSAIDRPAT